MLVAKSHHAMMMSGDFKFLITFYTRENDVFITHMEMSFELISLNGGDS